jgi:hypothetical protein
LSRANTYVQWSFDWGRGFAVRTISINNAVRTPKPKRHQNPQFARVLSILKFAVMPV